MTDYGIKVSRKNKDSDSVDERDFSVLSTSENHKLLFKGKVTGGSYTHNLNRLPVFFVFTADDLDNPTYFTRSETEGTPSTTNITGLPDPCYLVIFREGV